MSVNLSDQGEYMTGHRQPAGRLRGQANRRDVLRRLIAATERLLARGRPFSGITVGQLASEAGIARSTFYQHFPDRLALLREMTTVVLADTQDAATPLFELGPQAGVDDLQVAMRAIVDVFAQHQLLIRPILSATVQDPVVDAIYERALDRVVTTLEGFIHLHRPTGRLRDLNPRETATVIVHMIERTATRAATAQSTPEQRDRIARTLAQVGWHAVFTDSAI